MTSTHQLPHRSTPDLIISYQLPHRSTPDDITPPTPTEFSQYLSPVVGGPAKMFCDRQIDTMSPLLLTWADAEVQTERCALFVVQLFPSIEIFVISVA